MLGKLADPSVQLQKYSVKAQQEVFPLSMQHSNGLQRAVGFPEFKISVNDRSRTTFSTRITEKGYLKLDA